MLSLLIGGPWVSIPVFATWLLAVPIDEAVGDDWSKRLERHPLFLKALLYVQLPALALTTFLFAYYLSDWTFLGDTLNQARARSNWFDILLLAGGVAMFYAISGTNVAHELVHRTSRRAVLTGRWLLSFSLDTAFALEHVYGHHITIGTPNDPATAPRGMGFWRFFVRILWLEQRNAWRIEKRFLERRGLPLWSARNRYLTGIAMSAVWVALFAVAAGSVGVGLFLLTALWAKLYLELTNYIEHYGLVRVPGMRVEPRHSWNSSRRVTNWILFNLPRHADHHIKPGKNYWELESLDDAPQLPHGYFLMAAMAMSPPLFRAKMKEPLAEWDRNYASPGERALLAATAGDTVNVTHGAGGAIAEIPAESQLRQ